MKHIIGVFIALFGLSVFCTADQLSHAGGAGHALLFRDHGVAIEGFNDLAPNYFTFEAWLRTDDTCHRSAIFSYAVRPDPWATESDRTRAANAFVIFDQNELVACRDFEYIDLWPDDHSVSCYAAFNHSSALPSIVEADGRWHHLAVTWTAANNGLTKLYVDGLLRVQTQTGKTAPLQRGGSLMVGAEQDCYGGCLDRGQGFYGEIDEVRIWKVERTQEEILKYMRDSYSLDRHPDLAAYWHFNDPMEQGLLHGALVAEDSSGRGNALQLITIPTSSIQSITFPALAAQQQQRMDNVGVLSFRNNLAMNQGFQGMPEGDITIEFWARTPEYNKSTSQTDVDTEFFNFASMVAQSSRGGEASVFLDDAILIEKYSKEFRGSYLMDYQDITTRGSISVHFNANRQGMGQRNDHWVDFSVGWVDSEWHHVAVTWAQSTGEVSLYFDGQAQTPFWRSSAGVVEAKLVESGGVSRKIAAGTTRSSNGSLVLGNKQESYGGGFSPQYSMHGDMANLKIWNRVLSNAEVKSSMTTSAGGATGLVFSYEFNPNNMRVSKDGMVGAVLDTFSTFKNDLYLSADAPQWVYSTAPLADQNGMPVPPPTPGAAGYALYLSDQQVLIHANFQNFPATELTVEFWMLSNDACREGVPFSYATGGYAKNDNSFLIFNYNDFGVSVMEDEGTLADHTSGIAATTGTWQHVAVTWRSDTGDTKLYINGRESWSVYRGRGKRIPSGGTLVIGREQDCEGGCFDSEYGAAGPVEDDYEMQEYGAQDFFGLVDEVRVWSKARSVEQIAAAMRANLAAKGRPGGKDSFVPPIDPADPDLVAYWTFDEGKGYLVKDMTGHGHDLVATQPTRWETVRPGLAICGNGVLEGLEECDTGDLGAGKGCNEECKVEKGWECSKLSPSRCWQIGDEPSSGESGSSAPPSQPKEPRNRSALVVILSTIAGVSVFAAIGAGLVIQREDVYDRFPAVESAVHAVGEKVESLLTRVGVLKRNFAADGEYSFAGDLNAPLDPGNGGGGSPLFTQSVAPPGRWFGGYSRLPGQAPEGP